MKVYAYVSVQTCLHEALRPGSVVGFDSTPVSRHREYTPWLVGKRETLAIIARGSPNYSRYYHYQCARLVAELLGWSQKGTK